MSATQVVHDAACYCTCHDTRHGMMTPFKIIKLGQHRQVVCQARLVE
jgi:hypothetical protein